MGRTDRIEGGDPSATDAEILPTKPLSKAEEKAARRRNKNSGSTSTTSPVSPAPFAFIPETELHPVGTPEPIEASTQTQPAEVTESSDTKVTAELLVPDAGLIVEGTEGPTDIDRQWLYQRAVKLGFTPQDLKKRTYDEV